MDDVNVLGVALLIITAAAALTMTVRRARFVLGLVSASILLLSFTLSAVLFELALSCGSCDAGDMARGEFSALLLVLLAVLTGAILAVLWVGHLIGRG